MHLTVTKDISFRDLSSLSARTSVVSCQGNNHVCVYGVSVCTGEKTRFKRVGGGHA